MFKNKRRGNPSLLGGMYMSKDYDISYSALSTLLHCSEQYYLRYIKKIRPPAKGVFVRGRASHAGIAEYWEVVREGDTPYTIEEVQYITADAFESEAEDAIFESKAERGKLLDQAVQAVKVYLTNIAPLIGVPRMIEQSIIWKLPISDDEFLRVISILDIVDQSGVIRDNKVFSKKPPFKDIDSSLQLTSYCLAYRAETGDIEAGVALDCMILSKEPKAFVLDSIRGEDDFLFFQQIVRGAWAQLKAGIFYPNPTCFTCSENCDQYLHCQKSKTKKSIFVA